MKLIKKDQQKRVIYNQEKIQFSSFSSWHLIIINARAKSEKQLSLQATDDEDLTVSIDDKTFPEAGSNRLIDSPAAFSGGKLYDLIKTVYFLTNLSGKDHKLILKVDDTPGTATFEKLEIYTLDSTDKLILESKIQAEDGDRREWITFVLDNLPLKEFAVSFNLKRRFIDSDDVKVIVDGDVKRNNSSLLHKLWYFIASLLTGETQAETFSVNLSVGLHYIEFWADRMPVFEKITLDFGSQLPTKRIPTIDNPEWTGNLDDDTEIMLLARTVYGETGGEDEEAKIAVAWAIRNRVEDNQNRWGKSYHDVILSDFQYEPFNNPNSDPFKKITQPLLGDPLEKRVWQESYRVAEAVFLGKESDSTKGANHFYVPSEQPKQDWVDEKKFTVQIGATRFYKL